jgi:hypothetical protein
MRAWGVVVIAALLAGDSCRAHEKNAARRGKEALLGQSFAPPLVTRSAYEDLWRVWGLKERPADFDRRLRERYGLHEAPYPNQGLPMGLREARGVLGKGVGTDCLMCHASTIAGRTVLGLGNPSLDLQALFEELALAQGFRQPAPLPFSNVRGTTESAAAAAFLFQFRNPDLTIRAPRKGEFATTACEDVPAWWLMKKKTTMYALGSHSARSVRSLMAFMLSPLNSGEYIKSQEPAFRDIQAFLLTLEPPKYPWAVDHKRAEAGRGLFERNCSRCHGTHGPDGKYPNKVIDLEVIGTDPVLATGFPQEAEDEYNRSWFGQERTPEGKPIPARAHRGYQAPPLDGVWATAPYFHNGAVPTLYHVLNSKARPRLFTRSFRTGVEDYDQARVGWKFTRLEKEPDPNLPGIERRKVYDTTRPGRANTGHTFGDRLTDEERTAIIEYLKTL